MTTRTVLAEDQVPVRKHECHPKPTFMCHAVFTSLGLLVLIAAGFKTYELCGQPMPRLSVTGTLVLVCFEIALGAWLLIGVNSLWTLRTAAVCFTVFAGVSAYKFVVGASSCGCFGTLNVSPAITFVMDVAAVAMLLLCRKGVETRCVSTLRGAFPRVALLVTALSIPATFLTLYSQSRFSQSDSTRSMGGDLVVLDPTLWAGKYWPLLGEPDLPDALGSGEWDLLLFRHDCHMCHDAMMEIEAVLSTQGESRRIGLIGVDGPRRDKQTEKLQKLGCLIAYLPQDREWFATTPLRLSLNDGVCVSALVIQHWE